MGRQRRSVKLLALIGALSLVAAACGGDDDGSEGDAAEQPEEAPEGGSLIIAAEQEGQCMDWISLCSGSSWFYWTVNVQTMPRAFDVVKDGDEWVYAPSAMLAGEPEIQTEPDQVVTYEIADEAVWNDEEPIVCADFVYTWEQISTGDDIYDRTGYTQIASVDCPDGVDGKTVVTTYGETFAGWHQNFGGNFGVYPSHILEGQDHLEVMSDGYEFSAGPWVLDEYQPGVELRLVPNESYWGEIPRLDSVTFRFITNTSAELQALKAGEVDGAYPQSQPDLITELDAGIPGMQFTFELNTPNLEALWFNNEVPPFDDPAVRQAFSYAIDREAIVERLFGAVGVEEPMQSFNPPILGDFGDPQAFAGYERDLDQVTELMEGAGWEQDSDGFWAKDGQRATIVFKTTAGNQRRELTQDIVIDQAAEAGFEVTEDNAEAGDLFGEQLPQGQYQMALYAQVLTSLESNACVLFCTKNLPSEENGFSGQNWTRTVVEGLDEPLLQVDANPVPEERAAAAAEADAILAEEAVSLPLDPLPNIVVWSDRIVGPVDDNPILGPFHDMNLWGVEG